MIAPEIASAFKRYFQVAFADTPELRDHVHRIRYDVYCDELKYEPADKFPDNREFDEYDARSRHCLLLHRGSNIYAGCVRLVLPDQMNPEAGLPFERPCVGRLYPEIVEPIFDRRHAVGELSRLAVPLQFRHRKGEKNKVLGDLDIPEPKSVELRQFPHIPLGLYLACSAIGVMTGLDGVFAMMEPRLARHLRRFGIIFQQAGDVVDHHGQRAAFYISRHTLMNYLEPEIKKLMCELLEETPMALSLETA